MVDKMIYFRFVLIFFVFTCDVAFAQYVRKLKEPDFFIPYGDRMHKDENISDITKKEKTTAKTHVNKQKSEDIIFNEIPEYKKIFTEYTNSVNKFKKEKYFEVSDNFYNDLYLMEEGKIFEVEEDKSPSINTREQFEFYKLAKEISDN